MNSNRRLRNLFLKTVRFLIQLQYVRTRGVGFEMTMRGSTCHIEGAQSGIHKGD